MRDINAGFGSFCQYAFRFIREARIPCRLTVLYGSSRPILQKTRLTATVSEAASI